MDSDQWMAELGKEPISRADMNQLVMDYLIKSGFKEAAEHLATEADVPGKGEEGIEQRIRIKQFIMAGQVQDAITLINQLQADILEQDRHLLFQLKQQHLIELIRCGKLEEALSFAQAELAEHGAQNEAIRDQLERTMALLAFEHPEQSPFADLMDMNHRLKVASEVNEAILRCRTDYSTPQLMHLVQMLFWSQQKLQDAKINVPRVAPDLSGFEVIAENADVNMD